MRRKFLGDSFDAVKRLWCEVFDDWAPLQADPRFVPSDIWDDFTRITRIPILGKHPPTVFSVFNDPDTGIRLPNRQNQSESIAHVNLGTIADQLQNSAVRCVLTFDQSHHREPGFSHADQRNSKMKWLHEQGLNAFYYVSHAPFLFTFREMARMQEMQARLLAIGVPAHRIVPVQ